MRLPQSSGQPPSIRVISIVSLIILAILLPLGARAATQELTASPSSLRFGHVTIGQTETQLVALTNIGTTSVTISATSILGSEFSVSGLSVPATIAPGQSVNVSVIFSPTTAAWIGGGVTFTCTGSNPSLQLPVAGNGVSSEAMTATPASLSFGKVAVGSNTTLSVVLTNARTWNETVTEFQPVGNGFSVSGPTLPAIVKPGQSIVMNVTFTPPAAGLTGGSVFITGPGLDIPFTGTGTSNTVGQLSVSPTALNYGNVMMGSTDTQTATLTATGGGVTISSAASSNSQFAMPGATFPITLGAGQSASLSVAFTPQSQGTTSATLSFSSNATNSKTSESLSGTGTPPEVSLSWNQSTSQVMGYNVYRRIALSGSYKKINSGLDPNTSFLDTTVAVGQTYDYATTAVDSSGQESSYSNQVEIVIP